jgi:hypothetical protein
MTPLKVSTSSSVFAAMGGAVEPPVAQLWKHGGGLQPASRGLAQGGGEGKAVGPHLLEQASHSGWIATEGPLQVLVPVVAMQGPVQHHQAARQPPVGKRALQAKTLGGALEGRSGSMAGRA